MYYRVKQGAITRVKHHRYIKDNSLSSRLHMGQTRASLIIQLSTNATQSSRIPRLR